MSGRASEKNSDRFRRSRQRELAERRARQVDFSEKNKSGRACPNFDRSVPLESQRSSGQRSMALETAPKNSHAYMRAFPGYPCRTSRVGSEKNSSYYEGTLSSQVPSILSGADPTNGVALKDFGGGSSTTTKLCQARIWANNIAIDSLRDSPAVVAPQVRRDVKGFDHHYRRRHQALPDRRPSRGDRQRWCVESEEIRSSSCYNSPCGCCPKFACAAGLPFDIDCGVTVRG